MVCACTLLYWNLQATELLRILIVSNILGYMLVNGRPEGAPVAACEGGTNIVPGHAPNTPSTTPVPYLVDLSDIPNTGYVPRWNYISKSCPIQDSISNYYFFLIVRLRGGSTNPDFRGFMIQGRVRADDSPAGFFRPRNSYNRQCDGNVSLYFSMTICIVLL